MRGVPRRWSAASRPSRARAASHGLRTALGRGRCATCFHAEAQRTTDEDRGATTAVRSCELLITRSRGAWGGPRQIRRSERLNADFKVLVWNVDGEERRTATEHSTPSVVLCASAHLCASAWKHVARWCVPAPPMARWPSIGRIAIPRLAALARNDPSPPSVPSCGPRARCRRVRCLLQHERLDHSHLIAREILRERRHA